MSILKLLVLVYLCNCYNPLRCVLSTTQTERSTLLSPIVHLTVNSFNLLEATSSLSYYNKLQYSITRRATTLYLVRSSRALAELARLSKVVDGTFSRIPWLVQGPSPLKAPLFSSCAAIVLMYLVLPTLNLSSPPLPRLHKGGQRRKQKSPVQ